MDAIIKTGGKQLKVEVGQAIYVEKLNVAEGEVVKTYPAIGSFVSKDERIEVYIKKNSASSEGEQQ